MIAEGYHNQQVRNFFTCLQSSAEFLRQPSNRQSLSEILFEIFFNHSWLKLETTFVHDWYGHFFRITGTKFGTTHIIYQFDETIRICRWSHEDGIVIPISCDNIQEVIKTIENTYRKAH